MKSLIPLLLVIPTLLSANVASPIPPGKWQCLAFDLKENSYPGIGVNAKQAMLNSKSNCAHASTLPKSCRSAESFCEQGPISLMGDSCLVTDQTGHSWNTTGTDACKSAMELCTQFQFLYSYASQCNVKHR
jgi:hypothetical protein